MHEMDTFLQRTKLPEELTHEEIGNLSTPVQREEVKSVINKLVGRQANTYILIYIQKKYNENPWAR